MVVFVSLLVVSTSVRKFVRSSFVRALFVHGISSVRQSISSVVRNSFIHQVVSSWPSQVSSFIHVFVHCLVCTSVRSPLVHGNSSFILEFVRMFVRSPLVCSPLVHRITSVHQSISSVVRNSSVHQVSFSTHVSLSAISASVCEFVRSPN